uniref:UDP-2,4-diacetamido-2,4, 6-trideoxy-beta-L-altropyranose hydrolase n=1 Tax=Algoriphagus sp. TaxID=1872435 RepID=UPI0040478714
MNIVFRVDSSMQIGAGHVMRCLTLAKELKKTANVQFICRNRKGHLINRIESEGFEVFRLNGEVLKHDIEKLSEVDWLGTTQEQDVLDCTKILKNIKPDWLIVDHYGIDNFWHERLQKYYKKLLVIDDLANRQYNCDLLLDQNFYQDKNARYKNLVASKCKLLLGPKYALLREEFLSQLPNVENEGVNRVLVYFGGSDIKNNTLKVLQGIQSCKQADIFIDVVIGPDSPYRKDILNFSSSMKNIVCFDFVENMAEMMCNSDLYIGSAGTTTWERCCMGLPSIVIGVAENQIEPMEAMELAGMTFFLGSEENVSRAQISALLDNILNNPSVLSKMRKKNLELVDGYGASRCVSEMLIN